MLLLFLPMAIEQKNGDTNNNIAQFIGQVRLLISKLEIGQNLFWQWPPPAINLNNILQFP